MEAGGGFEPPMIRAYETGLLATLPAKNLWSAYKDLNLDLMTPNHERYQITL